MHLSIRIFVVLTLLATLAPLQGSFRPSDLDDGLRIEPSHTRVGLARVYLEVSDLAMRGDRLTGRYRIRVPLLPSKNDVGSIQLTPPREAGGAIGLLVGHAHSDDGGVRRDVSCEILDEETLRIDIFTDDRVLTFQTHYARIAVGRS